MKNTNLLLIATVATLLAINSCGEKKKDSEKVVSAKTDSLNSTVEPVTSKMGDTTENSVDWNGTYKGELPCADCEGIATTIELKSDNTFVQKNEYKGKGKDNAFEEKGSFEWDKYGSIITLKLKDGVQKYKVAEGYITHLDQNGKEITGDLAKKYILNKQ
ncbi:copper resistance protein NlpE [Elizabethkingia occulta]|uniref:Copper resistance protein NlpE n=1 Tax=Elizabethkingia occulta TaxID=1867263 RepID=A0A1T3MNY5_9FLAO|nr:copper resistance protein NlpE [Elizabethkingia occulta]OPC66246.1 hypothetical protein BAZ10_03190 [Elizabethkingia occulta]